jgi:hypothetical protein
MSDVSNNNVYPEEWDDLIKLMPYEELNKINSGLMRMTKGEKIAFMTLLINESKKELENQGLTTDLKELN